MIAIKHCKPTLEFGPSKASMVLVAALYFVYYTQFLFKFPIPFFTSMSLLLIIGITNIGTIGRYHFIILVSISSVVCALSLLSVMWTGDFDIVTSLLYLLASLFSGFALYAEMRRWPRWLIARFFGVAAISILIVAGLETAIPAVKTLSDFVRSWNFGGAEYAADIRDIIEMGGVRPKAFTREPSHLARHFAVFSSFWFIASSSKLKLYIYFMMFLLAFAIIRSPVLFTMVAIVAIWFFVDPERQYRQPYFRSARIGLVAFGLLVLPTLPSIAVNIPFMSQRMEKIVSGEDGSLYMRLVGPALAIPMLLSHNPIFGLGVGGEDKYREEIVSLISVDKRQYAYIYGKGIQENVFRGIYYQFVVYFGLFGSIVVGFLLYKMSHLLCDDNFRFFILVFFVFSLALGAFVGLDVWLLYFGLAAVVDSLKRSRW